MNIIEKVCGAMVENQLNFDIRRYLQPKSQAGKYERVPMYIEKQMAKSTKMPGRL